MLSTLAHLLRLGRAGFVLAREGVFAGLDVRGLPPLARLGIGLANAMARRHGTSAPGLSALAVAMARLGPSYVKLGQFLATRPDVVGPAIVKDLESLQDRVAPFAQDIALKRLEAAFDQPVSSLFAEFGPPIAAASIAQVHKARLAGADAHSFVAVKILRPDVERNFRRDLSDMYFAATLARRFLADSARLKPVEVVDTLARSVRIEMDFRLEAAAASEFGENTKNDKDFRVPAVDWERTARDVLTLEWVDGIPLSDTSALKAAGHDLPAIGRCVIQSFLRHAMRDGFFHADMHQGNLFVDAQGRLVAVDFGIMGRLGVKERRFLAEILHGFITRNYRRVAEVHFEAGYVPPIHRIEDFAQAIRAIGEPIHSRTADQISMAKLLALLFEVTALFDMSTRIELVMLQKTMVVVEGVGRTLDPHLDMWSIAAPVVREWLESQLGPLGQLRSAGQEAAKLVSWAAHVPDLLARAERLSQKLEDACGQGFSLAPASLEALRRKDDSRWGSLALWAIAAMLAVLVWREM